MRKKYFLTFFIFFSVTISSVAQNDSECEQVLTQAQDEFNAGHFYGLPAILKDCLPKFSTEQSVRAYLLLAQSYLLIDDPIAAEDSYLKLLGADPEYVADVSKDPIDIFYLSKKFTTTPVFTPHFRAGGNTSVYRLIHEANTFSNPASNPIDAHHRLKTGFQFGGGLDWNFSENISLCTELTFSRKVFKNTYGRIFDLDNLTYTEKQNWFDIPLYLKYSDLEGKIRPFAYAGYSLNILVAPAAELIYTNNIAKGYTTDNAKGGQIPTSGKDFDLTYKRHAFNRSVIVGGGFKYKVGKDFVFADVRYMFGLTNLANPATNYYQGGVGSADQYTMAIPLTKYSFAGDYFRLDNLSISIGYVKPIYHPSRVTKMHSRKTLLKISKNKKDNSE